MSTNTPDVDKSRQHRTRHFVSLTTPTAITEGTLPRLAEPRTGEVAGDGELAFAVAHQHGVVQDFSDHHEFEALCVLHLTADGSRAVELWIPAARNQLERVPRVTRARADMLQSAGCDFADALALHPEVADE
jgi:hypothetical protein